MIILNEWETILKISGGYSFSKICDGELKFLVEGKQKFTKFDKELKETLKKALKPREGFFAGVPTVYDSFQRVTKERRKFWENWMESKGRKAKKFLKAEVYGSCFISRMEQVPWVNTERYWEKVRGIWAGKELIGITGEHFSLGEYGLFGKPKEIKVPSFNAWSARKKVLKEAQKHKGAVFLLSCGVSASGLAYLLWEEGHQAVDIGKMGRGYLDGSYEGYKRNLREGFPW